MLCPIKVNSNTIELTVPTFCYCILGLLCVTHFINPKFYYSRLALFSACIFSSLSPFYKYEKGNSRTIAKYIISPFLSCHALTPRHLSFCLSLDKNFGITIFCLLIFICRVGFLVRNRITLTEILTNSCVHKLFVKYQVDFMQTKTKEKAKKRKNQRESKRERERERERDRERKKRRKKD